MKSPETFDQSMIDQIVATAESDTVESRVASLEGEVTEIKGSIKSLLIDIRETMGVLENPFQNIQGIANISSAVLNPKNPEKEEFPPEAEDLTPEPKETEADEEGDIELIEDLPKDLIEAPKPALKIPKRQAGSKLVDPMSFYKTIVWSKEMVGKYDQDVIKELVDIFSLMGYIPADIKDIVTKIIEILANNNDLDSAVTDLYRLYHILNPEDLSLDSKVLDYVLNENDSVKNLCQRK
jgi:hypothetical protein